MASAPRWFTVLILVLLAAVVAAGGIAAWSRYGQSQPVVFAEAPAAPASGTVSIEGAVASPGIYPLRPGDTIDSLVQCAGGRTSAADGAQVRIYISGAEESAQPQKIDLNRAEKWLLEALPGIGAVKAQAIIDYRTRNGGFRSTSELTGVEGVDAATYDRLKNLVTVGG